MTAHSLARIVAEELATVGIAPFNGIRRWGRPRQTVWSLTLAGFGVRHYASGRKVYIVQTKMAGRVRTVTIGMPNCSPMQRQPMLQSAYCCAHKQATIQPTRQSVFVRLRVLMCFWRSFGRRSPSSGNHRRLPAMIFPAANIWTVPFPVVSLTRLRKPRCSNGSSA